MKHPCGFGKRFGAWPARDFEMQRYGADDLEELRKARPYLRSAAAFLIYLVKPHVPHAAAYLIADEFLDQLAEDVGGGGAAAKE